MATILNASNSSGLTLTSDLSGALALQSNGTTVMTANSTGATFSNGSLCRAWVNFSGTTINGSFNVTSVTNPATGTYTITFTTAMPNANYAILISNSFASGVIETVSGVVYNDAPYSPTTSAFTVKFYRNDTRAAINVTFGYVAIFA